MIRAFSFLQRHPKSGIIYFRKTIPQRYRQAFNGKLEFKRSLRTCDKKVAAPLAMTLYGELQSKFNEIDGMVADMGNENLMQKITASVFDSKGQKRERTFDTGDDEKDMELADKFEEKYASAVAVEPTPISAPVEKKDSEPLATVCKKFHAEMLASGTWKPKTAVEYEASFSILIEILRNLQIAKVGYAKGRLVKETLLALPPNHTKGIYAGKTIKQIIKMKPERTLSPRSVNQNYIGRYSALFSWAVRQGYCDINPFEGLKISIKRKAIDEREPFTPDDLRVIFNNLDSLELKGREVWKYWVPYIALYSGARVNEIAQLREKDVYKENGVKVFRFTDIAGSVKNLSSERVVPVHPTLIEMGFLDYCIEVDCEGHERLFPDLYNVKTIRPGDKVSRWFNNTYMKNIGLRPTSRKISFHSLRHNFINFFKKMDIPEAKAKELTGHSHQSITYGRYGGKYDLKDLYDLISLLKYDL